MRSLVLNADYLYDVLGNRNEKVVTDGGGATTTRYAYDAWNPAKPAPIGTENADIWGVFNGSGSLTSRQLQGDGVDQHFAFVKNSNAYWYLADHLNSIRTVLDNSAAVQDAITYDGFGNIKTESASSARPLYTYTGRELDVETNLQYNRRRYYDATTGRWISQDPLGFDAGDSNLYRYVMNAPTNRADPSGLLEVDDRPDHPRNSTLKDVRLTVEGEINKVISQIASIAKTKLNADAPEFVDLVFSELGKDSEGSGVKSISGEKSQLAAVSPRLQGKLNEWKKEIAYIPFLVSRYAKTRILTSTHVSSFMSDRNGDDFRGAFLRQAFGGSIQFGINLGDVAKGGRVVGRHLGIIEGVPPAFFSLRTANHMLSPTIKIGKIVIGLDKLEHFFQQGYWLHKGAREKVLATDEMRKDFNHWMEGINTEGMKEAHKSSFEGFSRQFYKGFKQGTFGWATTDIASLADINANNDGFEFYNRLSDAYAKWRVGEEFPTTFSFGHYNFSLWNEVKVPNVIRPNGWVKDDANLGLP